MRIWVGCLVVMVGLAMRVEPAHAQVVGGACPDSQGSLQTCINDLKKVIAAGNRLSLAETAAAITKRMDMEHDQLIKDRGCGRYYGNRGSGPPAGVTNPRPSPTDCTTFLLDVLREAFYAQGKRAQWDALFQKAQANGNGTGFRGTDLMKALQTELNWTGIFYAPDVTKEAYSANNKYAAHVAKTKGTYYGINIDKQKLVINYRAGESTGNAATEALKKIPFGVLAANGGSHMALVLSGVVYEVHWADGCESMRLIESTDFAAWALSASGAIVVPPGSARVAFGGG